MTSDERIDVLVVAEDGWVDLWGDLRAEHTGTALAFHRGFWATLALYHRSGTLYSVADVVPDRPRGALSRLLASSVYNPWIGVRLVYRTAGTYTIDDLRSTLASAIDLDDDVLTQFHEAEELLAMVSAASSFDDLVEVVLTTRRESPAP